MSTSSKFKQHEKLTLLKSAQERGLTVSEFARELGLNKATVWQWCYRYGFRLKAITGPMSADLEMEIACAAGRACDVGKQYGIGDKKVLELRRIYGTGTQRKIVSIEKIQRVINADPKKTIKEVARETKVCRSTVSTIRKTVKALALMPALPPSLLK